MKFTQTANWVLTVAIGVMGMSAGGSAWAADAARMGKPNLPFAMEVKNMVGASGVVTIEVTPGSESGPESEIATASRACLVGAPASSCFETVADRKFGQPTTAEVLDIGDRRSGVLLMATVNGVTGSMRMVAVLGLSAGGQLVNLLPFVYVSDEDQFLYWRGTANSRIGALTVANTVWDLDHETRFDDHRYQISSYELCPGSKGFVLADRFNTRRKYAMETDGHPGNLVLKAIMPRVKARLGSKRMVGNCGKP
ncbi:MAG TPA: hypothetical protein VNW97_14510 [Candidatus Saccharimonadales bacterium]|jgi:hypothetical protein|nr:hypothetical protein [Candidatus Saccharimonadales bacterium]